MGEGVREMVVKRECQEGLFLFSCLFGDSPVDLCPRKVRSSVGSDVMFGFGVILSISGV